VLKSAWALTGALRGAKRLPVSPKCVRSIYWPGATNGGMVVSRDLSADSAMT